MSAPVDVMAMLDAQVRSALSLQSDAYWVQELPKVEAMRSEISDLVVCYDQMLARWWSNATDADKALATRAATARMRFAGKSHPAEPPLDEELGERRRAARP